MIKKTAFLLFLITAVTIPAYAQDGIDLIFRGVGETLFSVMEIPQGMMQGAVRNGFPFGLVTGAVGGVVRTVMGTLQGGADIARGAAPYAKYAALAFV